MREGEGVGALRSGVSRQNLAEDVRQNPASPVIIDFDGSVDTDENRHIKAGSIRFGDFQCRLRLWFEFIADPEQVERGIGQVLDSVVVRFVDKVARKHAHADQVAAVDAFE